MAFTINGVRSDDVHFVADIIASADADVGPLAVPHLLGSVPVEVTLTPLLAVAHVSEWVVSGIDATNIELVKANAVGSGDADPQVRLCVRLDPYRRR